MKKDIKHLTQEIFKDKQLFLSIGFNANESEVFQYLIQGNSIAEIAEKLNVSANAIRNIRNRRLHLIPNYLKRKITNCDNFNVAEIYQTLYDLNNLITNAITLLSQTQVYDLKELNLSRRTINSLYASNIKTSEKLTQYTIKELKQLNNIGDQAIKEVETALAKINLTLRTEMNKNCDCH